MAHSDVDGVSDPARHFLCKHAELEPYNLWLIEVVIFQQVLHRPKGTNTDVVNVEALCESSKCPFLPIAFENKIVVAFAAVKHSIEDVKVVVVEVEIEDIVVPEDFGLGSIKSHSLPNSVLETNNKVLGNVSQVAIELEALRQTSTFAI